MLSLCSSLWGGSDWIIYPSYSLGFKDQIMSWRCFSPDFSPKHQLIILALVWVELVCILFQKQKSPPSCSLSSCSRQNGVTWITSYSQGSVKKKVEDMWRVQFKLYLLSDSRCFMSVSACAGHIIKVKQRCAHCRRSVECRYWSCPGLPVREKDHWYTAPTLGGATTNFSYLLYLLSHFMGMVQWVFPLQEHPLLLRAGQATGQPRG